MKLSPQEIEQQHLDADTLAEAARQVREAGFVILEETMDRAWCDMMREAWDGHLEGQTPGDLLRPPFIDPLAIENPWAVQILDVMLGEDFWAKLPYHCNSTAPNWPETQVIHRDQLHLFPDLPIAMPPHMMVVNIPLVNFTEENGSTEVWPGSHLITDHEAVIDPADVRRAGGLEERALTLSSLRTNMPAWLHCGARHARLAPSHAQPHQPPPHHDVASVPPALPDLGLPVQGGRSATGGNHGPAIGASAADFSLQ